MSEAAVNEVLGDLLSPSQATTSVACPGKWYFRYLVGLTEPTTVHWHWAKRFMGPPHGKRRIVRGLRGGWQPGIADAALRDDEDAMELALLLLAGKFLSRPTCLKRLVR